jgi:hypothetical protein
LIEITLVNLHLIWSTIMMRVSLTAWVRRCSSIRHLIKLRNIHHCHLLHHMNLIDYLNLLHHWNLMRRRLVCDIEHYNLIINSIILTLSPRLLRACRIIILLVHQKLSQMLWVILILYDIWIIYDSWTTFYYLIWIFTLRVFQNFLDLNFIL